MRRVALLALPLVLSGLMLLSGLVSAQGVVVLFTPTAYAYLPLVGKAPPPTDTPTPAANQCGGSVTGQLTREDPNKPTYATNIENIWFYELIHNGTGSTACFGILGVNVTGPENFFHTSWSGQLAPGGVLPLHAGCYGPVGIPCNSDSGSAQQRDAVIMHLPGTYQLTLSICYSPFDACLQPGGNWQSLSAVSITAIDWTPQAPGTTLALPTPGPADRCRLVTDDPRGVYLSCPGQ